MATDFFQKQDDARRRTGRLVLMFGAAVIGIIAAVYLLIAAVNTFWIKADFWHWKPFLWITLGTAGLVGMGSGYKLAQLASGGSVVAADLGGRLVDPFTTEPDERRLINVVEEMSLASGMPVPQIFVMDREEGINAFAAGTTPSDAVIGITRGALRILSRDQLQGVIAHEFSHILNGDMKLNTRLIGWIHGLVLIALAGRLLLELRYMSSDNRKGGGLVMAVIVTGAGLMAIGSLGVLFARLIQAAVSRQREFLADASAVQFTRNPDGIAGALKKIGGISQGARLHSPKAEESRHMMFGESVMKLDDSLMATHPPLDVRIRAIDPSWDGRFPDVTSPPIGARHARRRGAQQREELPAFAAAATAAAREVVSGFSAPSRGDAAEAMSQVGEITSYGIDQARAMRARVPEDLMHLLHDPAGAQAVLFALLLSDDAASRPVEHAALAESVDPDTLATVESVEQMVTGWHNAHVLVLIDLAMPALRRLTFPEYSRMADVLQKMIGRDGRVALFEFMLQRVVRRHLEIHYQRRPAGRIAVRHFGEAHAELSILLSAAANLESRTEAEGRAAFTASAAWLEQQGVTVRPDFVVATLPQIGSALDVFDLATPLLKKNLLHACAHAVLADGSYGTDEATLLRAIADAIGCPMPPWVQEPSRS